MHDRIQLKYDYKSYRYLAAILLVAVSLFLASLPAAASVFGTVRGVVHDPQHHPVAGAAVTLQAGDSAYQLTTTSGNDGEFQFSAVPLGSYRVTVAAAGFVTETQALLLTSGAVPVLHFPLAIAGAAENVTVTAAEGEMDTTSPRRDIVITQQQISRYAGVDASNSYKLITDFVPGASVVHDQLHVRGGHQVTWALDGVPIPNTNIASNVGPQFNPRDVSYLQAETGSYAAEYGDRTYGIFNVEPNNGFERNRQAELIAGYGNYHQTDDWLSFGDHTAKFAYYASLSGNRSNHGLEPPTPLTLHDDAAGGGGFTSLLYNPTPRDQFRFDAGLRLDSYQVPNDPEQQAAGIADREREQDIFATGTWAHSFSSRLLLLVSPFYHFNRAAYEGGAQDVPSATDNRASNYEGSQITLAGVTRRHNARAGIYFFAQQDTTLFAVAANDGSGNQFRQTIRPAGHMEAVFLEDQFKALSWLTLTGGVRITHFSGGLTENAADPRLGAAVRLPKLNWVLRAAYSYAYQPPPLDTVSGPLLQFAAGQGVSFLPLRGERDLQQEYGVAIPFRNWNASVTWFRTGASNFFDHDALGNSNIFLPLTIAAARVRGVEVTLRSPLVLGRLHAHVAYSHQQAQAFGGITGGLTDFEPPPEGGFYLDHDQRDTLAAGAESDLPWHSFAAVTVNYGSGFLQGDGPEHLPAYATLDLSVGKSFGENLELRLLSTNLFNRMYQLDTSNTFGGTHFADPRMVSVQVKYRFRY